MVSRATAVHLLVSSLLVNMVMSIENDQWPMELKMLDAAAGAVCLDGTPAGFYFARARNAAMANNWQIFFEGGGWCYNENSCLARTNTIYGSSKSWANYSSVGGLMSSNCTDNPDFCEWNRVKIMYCDGNSFAGNRDEPILVSGVPLFFRGRRIMDAAFNALFAVGLRDAEQVLLTGCSAGGLATYLHADYVGDLVRANAPGLRTYKAVSISGFFLMHDTVEHKPVFPDEIKAIFTLSNSTEGLNSKCVASKPAELHWLCSFAQESYKFIETPFMVLNSALDGWQIDCILTAEPLPAASAQNGLCGAVPGWKVCSEDPEYCSPRQLLALVDYEKDFLNVIKHTSTFTKPGNGAFVYNCHTHCAGQTSAYNIIEIGGVSMQQAVSKWWASSTDEDAASNTYLPCLYHTTYTSGPVQCNPTCGSVRTVSQDWLYGVVGMYSVVFLGASLAVCRRCGANRSTRLVFFHLAIAAFCLFRGVEIACIAALHGRVVVGGGKDAVLTWAALICAWLACVVFFSVRIILLSVWVVYAEVNTAANIQKLQKRVFVVDVVILVLLSVEVGCVGVVAVFNPLATIYDTSVAGWSAAVVVGLVFPVGRSVYTLVAASIRAGQNWRHAFNETPGLTIAAAACLISLFLRAVVWLFQPESERIYLAVYPSQTYVHLVSLSASKNHVIVINS